MDSGTIGHTWYKATWVRTIWVAAGVPSFCAMLYCFLNYASGLRLFMPSNTRAAVDAATDDEMRPSAYGYLIDTADLPVDADVDASVNRWIKRGACAEIVYAVTLLALAITTSSHENDIELSMDSLEALFMCGCKFCVGYYAQQVHRHMSRASKTIAGPWLCVFAFSKFLMGCFCLLLSVGYVLYEMIRKVETSPDHESIMSVASSGLLGPLALLLGLHSPRRANTIILFCLVCSATLSLSLQTLSAFACFRIRERLAYIDDRRSVPRDIVRWWVALALCTFAAGIGMWLLPVAFIFEVSVDIWTWLGACYLIAASSQIGAGICMFRMNMLVKAFFASVEGKESINRAREFALRGMGGHGGSIVGKIEDAMEGY